MSDIEDKAARAAASECEKERVSTCGSGNAQRLTQNDPGPRSAPAATAGPNQIDGAPESEESRAVMKTSLRCAAIVSVLLPVCCFAQAYAQGLRLRATTT